MKKIIRMGTFETNSSSTHALTFLDQEEYEKLKKGELFLDYYYGDVCNEEERNRAVEEAIKEYNITREEALTHPSWYDVPITLEEYLDDDNLITEVYQHITKGREKVIVLAKYGYDG